MGHNAPSLMMVMMVVMMIMTRKMDAAAAAAEQVAGPATVLLFTSSFVATVPTGTFRFSVALVRFTVPAPPSVPPL